MSRIFISYRHTKPDEELANFLEQQLAAAGHSVFIDRQILLGTAWAEEIDRQIRAAQFFLALLSKDSIRSDMVRQEVKLAHKLRLQKQLTILPIRVAFTGDLPYDLGSYLNPLQYAVWQSHADHQSIAKQILAAINHAAALPMPASSQEEATTAQVQKLFEVTEAIGAPLPQADPRLVPQLELETGTLKLDSPFYLTRAADNELRTQVLRTGTTTVVKGPRQMGKSSLLARGLVHAQEQQHKAFYLDFQFLDPEHLRSLETLLLYFARRFARAFKTTLKPDTFWDAALGAKDNLTDFMEEAVLNAAQSPVLLLLDECDRVFEHSYRDDFFATLRGWHNLRATRASWQRFNLVIAHSTEPYLWIQDLNQSPFNVGYQIRLEDFAAEHIVALNAKHGGPLRTDKEAKTLHALVGGQPYLVRLGLYLMATQSMALADLQKIITDDFGPFGDHLRRFVWGFQQNPALKEALRQALRHRQCDEETHFQRLRAAGLIKGEHRHEVRMRCDLYEQYFKKHL